MKPKLVDAIPVEQLSEPVEAASPQIGRYVVERLLARGGMAEVYLGKALGPAGFSKRVVIKRILPNFAEDESFVTMFLNEARLVALLEHPNIVQVFDFGEQSNTYYIAMEYVEGASLRSIFKFFKARGERIPLTPVLAWVQNICQGLAYAHNLKDDSGKSQGIVHRDITPENILVSKTGTAKVADFGVAKAAFNQQQVTAAGVVKGKLAYIAPEQVRGEAADKRLDVYSLGVTLYEMLAGVCPHSGVNELELLYSILNSDPPALQEVRPDVDPALSALVSRAIARDPNQRIADMQAFYSEIDDYLTSHNLRVKTSELAKIVAQVQQWVLQNSSSHDKVVLSGNPEPPPTRAKPPSYSSLPGTASLPVATPVHDHLPTIDVTGSRSTLVRRRLPLMLGALACAAVAIGVAALRPGRPAQGQGKSPPAVAASIQPQAQPLVGASVVSPSLQLATAKAEVSPSQRPELETTVSPASTPGKQPAPKATAPVAPPKHARPSHVAVVRPAPPIPPAPPPLVPAKATPPEPPESRAEKPPEPVAVEAPRVHSAPAVSGEGWLNLRTEPWCEVYYQGEMVGTTPINRLVFPAGRHVLRLVNKGMGVEKDIVVDIRPGEESTSRLRLDGG